MDVVQGWRKRSQRGDRLPSGSNQWSENDCSDSHAFQSEGEQSPSRVVLLETHGSTHAPCHGIRVRREWTIAVRPSEFRWSAERRFTCRMDAQGTGRTIEAHACGCNDDGPANGE